MRFVSTRGQSPAVGFADAVLSAYAPDGGLYVPAESLPRISLATLETWKELSFADVCARTLALFVGDEVPLAELREMAAGAYDESAFHHQPTLPLKVLAGRLCVLETFHGPTASFKDVGVRMVARLIAHFLLQRGRRANLLVETSGDTGPAALAACSGVEGMRVFCLYPRGRVSRVQELQLTTMPGQAANIHVFRTEGTTDDQAEVLKTCFGDEAFVREHGICSINSINIARVLSQAAMYVFAYLQAVSHGLVAELGQPVSFAVPSGAFGNCCGAYIAYGMGVPIARVQACTNANDILHRALAEGELRAGENVQTVSPAMDIQSAYNLERVLYFASERDAASVRAVMEAFEGTGRATLPAPLRRRLGATFASCSVSDEQTLATMGETWRLHGYALCPHSAVAVAGAAAGLVGPEGVFPTTGPVICVATAHVAKFEAAWRAALPPGEGTPLPSTPRIDALFAKREDFMELKKQGGSWRAEWVTSVKAAVVQHSSRAVAKL